MSDQVRSPAHHAVEHEDVETLAQLLDAGADPNEVDGGLTLLTHAIDIEGDGAQQQGSLSPCTPRQCSWPTAQILNWSIPKGIRPCRSLRNTGMNSRSVSYAGTWLATSCVSRCMARIGALGRARSASAWTDGCSARPTCRGRRRRLLCSRCLSVARRRRCGP